MEFSMLIIAAYTEYIINMTLSFSKEEVIIFPMKISNLAWSLLFLLIACVPDPDRAWLSVSELTPFVTATSREGAVPTLDVTPTSTPEPIPSPTPVTHILAQNETISSLALQYGLEINDILAINPEITPKALSVGSQILIPAAPPAETTAENVISELIGLLTEQPQCAHTGEGGLWCAANVKNPLNQSAGAVTLTFVLKDKTGQTLKEQSVPAMLNLIAPGGEIPAVVYFSPPVALDDIVSAILRSAVPVDPQNSEIISIAVKMNSINIHDRIALVSAEIPKDAEMSGEINIWVALIAYDHDGQIVGARRLEYPLAQADDENLEIKAYVYSNSRAIKSVKVLAEAIQKINEE